MIEAYFREAAAMVALGLEAFVVLVVAFAALQAVLGTIRLAFEADRGPLSEARRGVWLRFADWIMLALEFALAADIVRSAISPSWEEIGKLGAFAAIRTLLNYFLGKDVESFCAQLERSAARGSEA